AIQEVHYGYDGGPVDQVYKLPPCDILDPNSVPEDAKIDMKIPPKTKSMQVQLTYLDGTQSPVRSFNAPK
ncbi:MAG TPA: methyl-accepting chemotaxis protein, partial [Methyloceanibacter sp.]|nr:methyl-accepting chemotaxis protein [Methyloceanibacter sp.]